MADNVILTWDLFTFYIIPYNSIFDFIFYRWLGAWSRSTISLRYRYLKT